MPSPINIVPRPVFGTPTKNKINSPASTKRIRRTSPVLFSASRSYRTNESAPVNQKALVNLTGFPVEILEIRFQILPTAGDSLTGGAFSCSLKYMGKEDLTNSFVPVWSFARSYNMIDEMGLNADNGVLGFRMKLKRPLWIPKGGYLTAEFMNMGLTANSATARIGLAGRMLLDEPNPPRKLFLPYVSSWTSKQFDAYGVADTDQSTENELVNPFDAPLRVYRFTHHTNLFDTSGAKNHEYDNNYADVDSNLFQVKIMGSNGFAVVPVFSTINQVFQRMTRSWEIEHELGASGYYIAYLNKLAPATLSTAAVQAIQFIGMIGDREVKQ